MTRRSVSSESGDSVNYDRLTEAISFQNISNESFFIQKAEIEVAREGGVEKMIANVRYTKPGKYLISIRNKTGIEAARIFIGLDTIQINDRINRKLYCASPEYLNNKYGVTISLLPILFGDYIGKGINSDIWAACRNGVVTKETTSKGIKIKFEINCDIAKVISANGESSLNTNGILFKYSDFFMSGNKYFPGKIEVRDITPETVIVIRVQRVITPWDGIIEFIPGTRYEIVELL